jgi:Arc/MetJ-type ribon-helix-helix transcriptional regulator
MSVAQLVREAITLLLKEDQQARRRAAEDLFQIGAPVADWSEMKREIEEAHIEGRS